MERKLMFVVLATVAASAALSVMAETVTINPPAGTVTNAAGAEKAYTVTGLTVIFNDKNVVVTFSLKYGNMPFDFAGQFTGIKKD